VFDGVKQKPFEGMHSWDKHIELAAYSGIVVGEKRVNYAMVVLKRLVLYWDIQVVNNFLVDVADVI
jgi:hypothetical protein